MKLKYRPIKVNRHDMPVQDPVERVGNFKEVALGFDPEIARLEAMRCLQCKDPGCVAGCPVAIDIPAFIRCVADQNVSGAVRVIRERSSLPAVCGRVCPQETQCEERCILSRTSVPVAIGALERFVADYHENGNRAIIPETQPSTGKSVAVVGSGPSGLTVAGDLLLKGHSVTVFEAFHRAGGVLVYGIPEFRLPKAIVENEIGYLKRLGAQIETGSVIGKTMTLDELFDNEFHAVFVGVGAGYPKFLNIPGESLNGVCSANEYLTRVNLMKAYRYPEYDTPVPEGRKVCVFGAGNVAMDAARTAVRLGADSVTIVYRRTSNEMPARKEEISHAGEEGVRFQLLTSPVEFTGDGSGRIVSVRCQEMQSAETDSSGRARPVPVENGFFDIPCDLAIIAVGAGANQLLTESIPGMALNSRGNIKADSVTGKTSMNRVWAGGDIVTGQATVIEAMGAGRRAADDIHDWLTYDRDYWPGIERTG